MPNIISIASGELAGSGDIAFSQSVAAGNACLVILYAQTASNPFTVSGLGGTWESLGSSTPAGASHIEAWLCREADGTSNALHVAGGGTTKVVAQCWLADVVDHAIAPQVAFASGTSASTATAPVLPLSASDAMIVGIGRGLSGDTIPGISSAKSYYENNPGTGPYLVYGGAKTESDGPELRGYYYPAEFWSSVGSYAEQEIYSANTSAWSAVTVSLPSGAPPYADDIAQSGWMLVNPDGTVDVGDSITGPLRNATLAAGEPQPNGSMTDHTVWASFQAPVFGDWTFTGSTTEGYQLSLALYGGPAGATDFSSLTLVGQDDGSGGDPVILLNDANPGSWWYLQVGTSTVPVGATGSFAIHGVGPTPVAPDNDDFVDADLIDVGTYVVSTYGATNEVSEPRLLPTQGEYISNTVWYKAVSSGSGEYTVSCAGMVDDIEVGVYTGSALGSLTPVADIYEGQDAVDFTVTPGTTFYLQVGMYAPDGTAAGWVGYGSIVLDRVFGISDLTLSTDDNVLEEAPGQLVITVGNGDPDATVDFSIDGGAAFLTSTLDDFGSLYLHAIMLPSLSVGTHILDATSGSSSGSMQFTVLSTAGDDLADASDGPPSSQSIVTRWQFDDPTNDTQFVFPRNPQTMQPLFEPIPDYTVDGTTAHAGQSHTWEGSPKAAEWSFNGLVYTLAEFSDLQGWVDKQYRLFFHDHFDRVWRLYLASLEATPKRTLAYPQMQEYTVRALVLGRVS